MKIIFSERYFLITLFFSRDEIENKKTFLEFIEKDDLDRIKSYHFARRENPKSAPSEYECRLVNREGSLRDVYASVSLIPGTSRSTVLRSCE